MNSSKIDLLLKRLDEIEDNRQESKRLRTSSEWSEEQNKKFINCIKCQINSNVLTLNNTRNIDWKLVSEQLNRSVAKCRGHWFRRIRFSLIDNLENETINCWDELYDTARLISYIHKNCDIEEDIDWDFLKEKFKNIATYNKLLRVWRRLKASVPENNRKDFKQSIEWLIKHKMPDEVVLSDDEEY